MVRKMKVGDFELEGLDLWTPLKAVYNYLKYICL